MGAICLFWCDTSLSISRVWPHKMPTRHASCGEPGGDDVSSCACRGKLQCVSVCSTPVKLWDAGLTIMVWKGNCFPLSEGWNWRLKNERLPRATRICWRRDPSSSIAPLYYTHTLSLTPLRYFVSIKQLSVSTLWNKTILLLKPSLVESMYIAGEFLLGSHFVCLSALCHGLW